MRVVAKAATDHVGAVGFWQSSGTYSSSLVRRPDWMTERRVEVEATTIDAEIPEAAADVVVKIDAEGAELQVLAGLERLVGSAARAVLLVESNPAALARGRELAGRPRGGAPSARPRARPRRRGVTHGRAARERPDRRLEGEPALPLAGR